MNSTLSILRLSALFLIAVGCGYPEKHNNRISNLNTIETNQDSNLSLTPLGKEVLLNPNFQSIENWRINSTKEAKGVRPVVLNNHLRISSSNSGQDFWHIRMNQSVSLTSGRKYKVRFAVNAYWDREIRVVFKKASSPWDEKPWDNGAPKQVPIERGDKNSPSTVIERDFTCKTDCDNLMLEFQVGNSKQQVRFFSSSIKPYLDSNFSSGDIVTIKSVRTNLLIAVDGTGETESNPVAIGKFIGEEDKYKLTKNANNTWNIQSVKTGMFWKTLWNGQISANQTSTGGEFEAFVIENTGDNQFAIRSVRNGKLISNTQANSGKLVAEGSQLGPEDRYEIKLVGNSSNPEPQPQPQPNPQPQPEPIQNTSLDLATKLFPQQRMHEWHRAGIVGGIPQLPNKSIRVNNGNGNDATRVQAAIDNMGGPGVVFLPEGTWNFTSTVRLKPGIVIKGAGIDKTRIQINHGGDGFRANGNISGGSHTVQNGTKEHSKNIVINGANSLFKKGDFIEIYQRNDYSKIDPEPNRDPRDITGALRNWGNDSVAQIIEIASVNGNTVNLTDPIRIDMYAVSGTPVKARKLNLLKNIGFEDFQIIRNNTAKKMNFSLNYLNRCWIKNVHSKRAAKYHVHLTNSSHCEIRRNFFDDTQYRGGGGEGYGIALEWSSTDNLVIDNVFFKLRHAMQLKAAAGNVFAFNYSKESFGTGGGATFDLPDISLHGAYPFANLFEGNDVEWISCDSVWGSCGPDNTFYRNRVRQGRAGKFPMGIIFSYYSNNQTAIGNQLTEGSQGRIYQQSGSTGGFFHANLELNQDLKLRNGFSRDIGDSMFLTKVPGFLGSLPALGFDRKNAKIPAETRAENQFGIK